MKINALPIDQGMIQSYSSIVCFYSSFVNVAKYHNENICEEFVFLSRNGLKIETNIENVVSLKDIIISNRLNELVIDFLSVRNIECKFFNFNSSFDITEYIYEQLNQLNPVIIYVNANLINYGPTNLQNSNRNHALVLSSLDNATQTVYFYDYFIPTYPSKVFYGSVNIDDLLKMASINDNFNVFYFDYLKVKENIGAYEKNEFAIDLIKNIEIYMNDFAKMESIADTINKLLFKFSKEDIIKNLHEMVYQFMYCGIISTRILLRNICKKHNWPALYNELDAIASEWYKISLLLLKYSFIPSGENYNKISKRIFTLLEKEKSTIASMQTIL